MKGAKKESVEQIQTIKILREKLRDKNIYLIRLSMANGPPLVDVNQTNISHEFKAPQTFTPFSKEMLNNAQTNLTKTPEDGTQTMTKKPTFSN